MRLFPDSKVVIPTTLSPSEVAERLQGFVGTLAFHTYGRATTFKQGYFKGYVLGDMFGLTKAVNDGMYSVSATGQLIKTENGTLLNMRFKMPLITVIVCSLVVVISMVVMVVQIANAISAQTVDADIFICLGVIVLFWGLPAAIFHLGRKEMIRALQTILVK